MTVVVSREALMRVASHAWDAHPSAVFGFLLGRADNVVSVSLPAWTFPGIADSTVGWGHIAVRLVAAKSLAASSRLILLGAYASASSTETVQLDFGPSALYLSYGTVCCKSHSSVGLVRMGQGDVEWRVHRGVRESDSVNQKRVISRWRALIGSPAYDQLYTRGPVTPW